MEEGKAFFSPTFLPRAPLQVDFCMFSFSLIGFSFFGILCAIFVSLDTGTGAYLRGVGVFRGDFGLAAPRFPHCREEAWI